MTTFRMPRTDDFRNDHLLEKYLGRQLQKNRLALVLGAGISTSFRLPTWSELVKRLYDVNRAKLKPGDPKRQIEYLRNKYYHSQQSFVEAVRKALYQDVDVTYEALRRCDTLAAVAAIAMATGRRSPSQVITFNWDDLLERYLEYHGITTSSVFTDAHWATATDVTIFHPHGFLPLAADEKASDSIVFDQYSYSEIMGSKGEVWRQSLVSLMRSRTCLFIGLSGNDDNLDGLLNHVAERHACHSENTPYWGVTFTTSDDEPTTLFWKKRGIFSVRVSNYEVELPQRLFCIAQNAAGLKFPATKEHSRPSRGKRR